MIAVVIAVVVSVAALATLVFVVCCARILLERRQGRHEV
jgi:hypothetical protein